jgi:hypothetical protein
MKTLYKNMDNYVFAFRPSARERVCKAICKTIETALFVAFSIPLALYLTWIVVH